MKRRLNSTGRKRIERRHIDLSLRTTDQGVAPTFDLKIDLSSYRFPGEARVRLEAWRSNAVQRWECGTVGELRVPTDAERRVTEVPESAQFRLFVVDAGGTGRLLGHATKIRPVLPRRSILPLRETDELSDEIWRVDFGDGGDQPELLVNSKIDGISEVVRSDATFRVLVMPEVLRTILTHVVLIERSDPDDDESAWEGWFQLARSLLPDQKPPNLGSESSEGKLYAAREWIESVVSAFASRSVDAANQYNATLSDARA